VAVSVLALAEIAPEIVVGLSALALASDLQSLLSPYINSLVLWMKTLPLDFTPPVSKVSSSLYWSSFEDGNGFGLATYDEIMINKGLFVCMSDRGITTGVGVLPYQSPIPGSFTPVDEAQHKKNYCKYLGGKNNVAPENLPSWMTYCENTKY
jgi:hypothetical protein